MKTPNEKFEWEHCLGISKDSGQTAPMRRLTRGHAGGTYHIIGNLMPRLRLFDEIPSLNDVVTMYK